MSIDELTDHDLAEAAVRAAEAWHPETWLTRTLPAYVGARGDETPAEAEALFAPHHRDFWAWVWGVDDGARPESFIGVWGRGEAKSTSAEMACVALGARRRRRYVLYVSGTQDQADDHVGNVAAMLESTELGRWYPEMADRLLGKFGNSKGWRRNRIRTATGFTVDALGLDTAARGVKLEDQRPDLIIIDDVDAHDDSPVVTARKIDALTKKLLPAGSDDLAVLGIQNLVQRDGIFARLVDGRAQFLARRTVSGPIPAVRGLVVHHEVGADGRGRDVVVAGEPTWPAQTLARVQEKIDDWGLASFLAEAQHDMGNNDDALWTREQLARVRTAQGAEWDRVVVGVDPSGGSSSSNDAQGIVVAGRIGDLGVVLEDATVRLPPAGWGDRAVTAWDDWEADAFVVEVNFGGDMCADVLRSALERRYGTVRQEQTRTLGQGQGREMTLWLPNGRTAVIRLISASRGKRARAEPVAALYGRPDDPATWSTSRVHHLGHLAELEDEMTSWSPTATWSPNRMDAAVWALTDLLLDAPRRGRRRAIVGTHAA